ncbi:MAG: PH domain-containing protein [Actinomycetota bacterium]
MEPYRPLDDDEVSWFRRTLRPIYHRLPTVFQDFVDRAFDSLLPPTDDALLLVDEEIYYKSRRHVAEIIKPFLQLVGTVLLAVALTPGLPIVSGPVVTIAIAVLSLGLLLAVLDSDLRDLNKTIRSALPFFVLVAVVGVVYRVWAAALLVLLWVTGRLTIRLLRWRFFRVLYLTNRRLIQTEGFFSRRQATLPISRVTDVALSYGLVGEYLNYATFKVESAGQTLFREIEFLASPEEFHRMVIWLATSPRPLPADWERVIDRGLTRRSERRDYGP